MSLMKLRDIEGDKMAKVLDDMEEEIERQLDSKAQKSNLTVANVKNILKSVISNEDVMTMVRQSLQRNGEIECPYEPKLTRAKTKELLKLGSVPSVAGMWGLNLNKKIQSSKVLIEEEFSEDSSDEEYKPNEEEQSDDEDNKSESMRSDLESQPCTPASIHCAEKYNEDWTDDGVFRIPQENIGQRTRSKLSLSSTPLEAIEQAFVPPDITREMYDLACDNDDWFNFLKEFTQPLESDNNDVVDDVEADPEYNVLADEEAESVDKEELRMDRAVKVSRKELNALMAELFEYTDMMSSDDEDNPQETSSSQLINTLSASVFSDIMDEKQKEPVAMNENKTVVISEPKNLELTYAQRLLLYQQMRQHVQFLIQHFLLTYKHPTLGHLAPQCKSNLVTLKHLATSETSAFHTFNLTAALEAMEEWETILAHPLRGKNVVRFMKEELAKYEACKAKRQSYQCRFPRQLVSLVARSEAFVYPLLLPPVPFVNGNKQNKIYQFASSETMLIALCLEEVIPYMKANPKLYKRVQLPQLASLISEITMPECSPSSIKCHIKSMKKSSEDNPIKTYYETGKAPSLTHYIIPVIPGIKLILQPKELLPAPWRKFIKNQ